MNKTSYAEKGKTGFKRGNPGRPKGAKDKVARSVKENFDHTFEELGGSEGFVNWAKASKRNTELFYQWYSKMLPSNVSIKGDLKTTFQISEKFMPKAGNEKK